MVLIAEHLLLSGVMMMRGMAAKCTTALTGCGRSDWLSFNSPQPHVGRQRVEHLPAVGDVGQQRADTLAKSSGLRSTLRTE